MRISIRHKLTVSPPPGTANLVMQAMLTPKDSPSQRIENWALDMAGIDSAARFADAYGNQVHLVNQAKPDGTLTVTISGVVETNDTHGVLGRLPGEPVPALYTRITPLTKAPVSVYGKFRGGKENRLDVLHALMLRVSEALVLSPGNSAQQKQEQGSGGQSQSQGGQSQTMASSNPAAMTADGTPVVPEDPPPVIEEAGHEVAARLPRPPATDYAHLFVGAARALGIPARYVTGYLAGTGDEPAAFHAWAEAFDERLGWIGFDAMLEHCPTDRHVRVAVGLDALSAAPLRCVPAGNGVEDTALSIEILD
jgi:hypothetical protein